MWALRFTTKWQKSPMRRFNLSAVVVLIVAGLFAVASAGRPLDEQQMRKASAREFLNERVIIYNEIYEETRRLHDKGTASLNQLLEAQTSLYLVEPRSRRIDVLEKMLIGAKDIEKAMVTAGYVDGPQRIDWLKAKARVFEASGKLAIEQADRGY